MKVDVLLGLQWGDEGKGKIVDVLTPRYDIIARFQGGPNAGHTLQFGGNKYVLHTIPSGIFRENAMNVIGNGVVLDPHIFKEEIHKLELSGHNLFDKLILSSRTHLIMPTHKALDIAYENAKGMNKIGSTKKGIGPAYTDKIARLGLRLGDIYSDFQKKYYERKQEHLKLLQYYDYEFDIEAYEEEWFKGIELIKKFKIEDTEIYINNAIKEKKSILAEGAQGSLLDIEFGTYPFVTSSNTMTPGACTGLGIAPSKIGEVFGIMKAYCTRVGSGPFPTELVCKTGDLMREKGAEFGSTTGRPRRCGWLDMVALKYAIMINGVTQLIITKIDVLNEFDTIKVCTAYKKNGKLLEHFPADSEGIEPIYREFKGWKTDTTQISDYNKLPIELKDYIKYIETETEIPVMLVSVGAERNKTLFKTEL
ncbi:MAG: adenylosuccinate synthase [Bacteroidales bacterium]